VRPRLPAQLGALLHHLRAGPSRCAVSSV
jgi:hypothetical protein